MSQDTQRADKSRGAPAEGTPSSPGSQDPHHKKAPRRQGTIKSQEDQIQKTSDTGIIGCRPQPNFKTLWDSFLKNQIDLLKQKSQLTEL